MNIKSILTIISLAMMTSPAAAQSFVDAKIQELFSQGYTHFEVSRGLFATEIEAYGPDFTKIEIRLSNSDGAVLSQRTENEDEGGYRERVNEIREIAERRDYDDRYDDRDGDRYDDRDDDRYDDRDDDRYDDRDDDRYDDRDDDRYDDRDDDRYDDRDDDRYDDRDDDRYDDRDDDRYDDRDDDRYDDQDDDRYDDRDDDDDGPEDDD